MAARAGTGLRMLTVSRAAHRALHIDVERSGIRADRRSMGRRRQFSCGLKDVMPRKRESGIGARKTSRKPRKAARAAGTLSLIHI